MSDGPAIQIKGWNGRIELYKTFLRIDRGTLMGFISQGLKGKKDIPLDRVSSVQIKKPGLTPGYIQFSIAGGNESQGGVSAAVKDENTVTFRGRENYHKALAIRESIHKRRPGKQGLGSSVADEIEKLHGLLQKGIISREEFESGKAKLLV
jgi:hypothetical protein